MEASLSHSLVRLDAEQLLPVVAPRGRCLVVFQGKVWITQRGDARDHILSSGESFTFDQGGLALIEALEPTSLALLVESTQAVESIGYEAAWPQTEPRLARLDAHALHDRARHLRAQTRRRATQEVARAARKVWAGLTSVSPVRQAA